MEVLVLLYDHVFVLEFRSSSNRGKNLGNLIYQLKDERSWIQV